MIYLDHNASNPPDPRVLEVYRRGLSEAWANPSSQHGPGRRARALLEEGREQVATFLGVAPGQVTFTGSGTEALNQVLSTVVRSADLPDGARVPLVSGAVEHPAVLAKLDELVADGYASSTLAGVDPAGRVDAQALGALLSAETKLVSVLAAQNEVGTLQPSEAIAALCDAVGVPLLVDGTQAVGRLRRDWKLASWDYLVISAHKLRAPRGAAALVHRGRALEPLPLILGGSQERGRRGGTEAVAAIMALGFACELAGRGELIEPDALLAQRGHFEAALARIPGVEILAADAERLPQTTALTVLGGDSEALLAGLDLAGICASSGSACSSGALKPSHVLTAMGIPEERSRGRLRFSFGPETTDAELEQAAQALAKLV